MEERKKDKLEGDALDDFSIENIDDSLGIHKSIFEEDDHYKKDEPSKSDDNIEFDQTYLTNVSNDLVAEVNKVLNGFDEDDIDFEEEPKEKSEEKTEDTKESEELSKEDIQVLDEEPIVQIDEPVEEKVQVIEEPVVQIDEPEIEPVINKRRKVDEIDVEPIDWPVIDEIPQETKEIEEPKSLFETDEPKVEEEITKQESIEEPEEIIPDIEIPQITEEDLKEEEPLQDLDESRVEEETLQTFDEPKVEEEPLQVLDEPKEEEKPQEEIEKPKEEYESFYEHKPVSETHREEPKGDSGHRYISYETRVIRFSLVFLIFFVIGFFLLYKSININGEEYIDYTETSNLDYKVLLKENSFYEEKYLGKDMLYVASLIDKINIDFLYNFNINEKVNLDFNYVISGKLSIMDSEGKKVYLTKDYELLPSKTFSLKNEQDHTIVENIVIDYDQYNKLANSFKSTYGLDTTSKLEIYLNVVKSSNSENLVDVNVDNNMLIEIPLSERSVSISMDYKDINRQSRLVRKSSITIGNIVLVLVSILCMLIAFFGLYKVVSLLGLLNTKKSKYDKYIDKIMRQYDRLIVKHFTCPELSNYNVIKIKEFNELLDMRDNLKMPIMYYSVTEHEKSYFYIVNNNDLYLLVLKAVDLNK